jgi:hypothetical protein
LAAALDDPCITVRTEAARLLGQLGGPKEAVPLQQALHRALRRRSPYWHRVVGWLAAFGIGVAVAFMTVMIGIMSLGKAFKLKDVKSGQIWRDILEFQRGQEPFILACVDALAAITERAPTPESRQLLRELHALSADDVHLTRASRTAVVNAAERLDAATRSLAELPTPAAALEPSTESLPVTAEEPVQTVTLGG